MSLNIELFNMLHLLCLLCLFLGCQGKYLYKIEYIDLDVDHFSYVGSPKFKLRYLINDTYWKPGKPIFFYTGNEGDIENFAQNTGFMWEIAPNFEAMVVFGEHRYYGVSLPFGNKSYTSPQYLGYLTSQQALADYVTLLEDIKTKHKADRKHHKSPVIAFGGSYGGMLAAWMRLKYPSTIFASVASSAPILQFGDLTPCSSYSNIVASVFNVSVHGGVCAKNIKKTWKELRNINSTAEGRSWLSNQWKLCKPIETKADFDKLSSWLYDIYGDLAMINYPYPTNFLADLPGYPVRATCSHLTNTTLEGKSLLTALGKALSVYTNYTGTTKCLDINQSMNSKLNGQGWDFQACTELVMPMCDEDNAIYERREWNLQSYQQNCKQMFGIAFERPNDAVSIYGGKTAPYSNVIFTNGLLDPWSAGGMLQTSLPSVYSIIIPNAAHHLDLRASNPNDPASVISARSDIVSILKTWIELYNKSI